MTVGKRQAVAVTPNGLALRCSAGREGTDILLCELMLIFKTVAFLHSRKMIHAMPFIHVLNKEKKALQNSPTLCMNRSHDSRTRDVAKSACPGFERFHQEVAQVRVQVFPPHALTRPWLTH